MRAEMKSFSERNLVVIGAAGLVATVAVLLVALNFDRLPLLSSGKTYSAYFADAAGLESDADVQVSGYRMGSVTGMELDGNKVRVTFKITGDVRLGERTEAAIQNSTLLGTKIVELTPRGDGQLSETIPMERTTTPYQIPDALGDLTKTINGLNTNQLSDALATLADTFKNTAPDLRIAVAGVSRISQTLNTRDQQLRNLLANADKATSVLAQRSDQVVSLVANTNALLAQLLTESGALNQIAYNLSALAQQLKGVIAENRDQLRPALDKLNGVLTIVDNRKERVQKAVKLLNAYAMSLGESVATGPWFDAYVANLLPGQFVQPFVDAAFSDLGIDPHTLLPSQRTEPQTGQPATPALPSPFPRTGQGGEPRLTLPDAITGNPGDVVCPGPAPGCYPYREPPPAPPPGGPPPGPPAPAPPGFASVPEPTPSPVSVPAPGEVPPGPVGPGPPPGPSGLSPGSGQ
jgi:phospholipid/cholesterol/gamma-HCH transport system substrate-binding protein